MRDFRWLRGQTLWSLLLAAAACLASGSSLATVPVTQMMYVQPIDVCPDRGATGNCAPFNTLSPIGNPNNQDQTKNPIGFVDAASGKDITRVLLNQIGVDVTWLPIAQLDKSSFQTLNVLQGSTTCGLGTTLTGYQSCDLLTLTDQNCIATDPNCAPPSPLNPNTHVFNLFFVNKLNPPASQPGTQIYDLVWVGNNGGALGGNVFFPPFPLTPRTDVPAHGLMHGLGADHTILGAGPYNPFDPTTNPLGGVVPPIPPNPVIGECDAAYPACKANLMTTGNLRIQPSPACMLAAPPLPSSCVVNSVPKPTFSNGMADQATTEAMENTLLPTSQQRYELMSGFLTPIANTPTTACTTTPCPATATVTRSTTQGGKALLSTASNTSTSGSSITFDLPGPVDGLPGDTLTAWILIVPQGQSFGAGNPFRVISQSRENLLQDVDLPHPDTDVPYSPCAAATVQCVEVEFNRNAGQGFGALATDHIQFSLSILIGGSPITLDELCGAKVVYIFKSGAIITSTLGPCSGSGATVLKANPQNPDATTPNQVVSPSTLVTAANIPPCTPDPTTGLCRDPRVTGVEDGNPSEEAQLCYFHGRPVPCP
jgi:hypothetical protein